MIDPMFCSDSALRRCRGLAIVPFLSAAICFASFSSACPAASFHGLGILSGATGISRAWGISHDGSVVVGDSEFGNQKEAFRWTRSTGFQGLGDLPGGSDSSTASEISEDGTTIIGLGSTNSNVPRLPRDVGTIWTAAEGLRSVEDVITSEGRVDLGGLNANGAVVVGSWSRAVGQSEAFRWIHGSTIEPLGDFAGGSVNSGAGAVTPDGAVIVGSGTSTAGHEAMRWTAAGGMERLGTLSVGDTASATGVSEDGQVVVGHSRGTFTVRGFRWTAAGGLQPLGGAEVGCPNTLVNGVSGDGATIVGQCTDGGGPFIWTVDRGLRPLQEVLTADYGLNLSGWILGPATDISLDGRTIVGYGVSPRHSSEAWVAVLDDPYRLALVRHRSNWRYLDDGSNQGTAWPAPGFADGGWETGPGQFGYGDDDEATLINAGTDPQQKPITTYFRHTFDLPMDPRLARTLNVELLVDDGAAVFLNGAPLVHHNLAVDAAYDTPATATVAGDDERRYVEIAIDVASLAPGALRQGPNTLAVEVHQAARNSSDISFDLGLEVTKLPALVPKGARWSYLDDGTDQQTAWRQPGFDDSEWPVAPAELGYGDLKEATTVGFGVDPADKHVTTYFRHVFEVTDRARIAQLILELLRDDGAAVFLNGQEIARTNLAAEADFDDLATVAIGGDDETRFVMFEVDSGLLRDGVNVLAVEVHQSTPGSSDLGFDLSLTPLLRPIPEPSTAGLVLVVVFLVAVCRKLRHVRRVEGSPVRKPVAWMTALVVLSFARLIRRARWTRAAP